MADYAVTAVNVLASAGAQVDRLKNAGEALARGDAVYLEAATSTWKKMDANAGATGNGIADVKGIVLNDAAAGQPVAVCTSDPNFTHGLTVVAAGAVIVASANAGKMAPHSDLASGWFPTVMGVAINAATMKLNPLSGGAAIP